MFWKKRDKIDPDSDTAKIIKNGKKSFWKDRKNKKKSTDFSNVDTSYDGPIYDEIKKSQEDKTITNPYDLKSHQPGFPSQSQHSAKWDHNEKIDSKRKKPDSGE